MRPYDEKMGHKNRVARYRLMDRVRDLLRALRDK